MDDPRGPKQTVSRRQLPKLARAFGAVARDTPERIAEHLSKLDLAAQAELALRVPVAERLTILLNSPKPMRLVRALPDADFYITAREAGPQDALPMIRLGSFEQLQHLLDRESWRGDRFDGDRSGAWVALLLESGEPALRRFLRETDEDLLALLLAKWIRTSQIKYEDGADVHGHGVSEVGTEKGAVTPDGYYYFRPTVSEHLPAVRRLLEILYREFPERYQRAIWSAMWELPSELEERALYWRQSRLEEHGFPPPDEALKVYAPPSGNRTVALPLPATDARGLGASRTALTVLEPETGLAPAIERLGESIRERVLHEAASLANHLLVADGSDTGDPEALRDAIRKGANFVSIGLAARGSGDSGSAAQLLSEHPVMELFREGHALAVELQQRARLLLRDGWAGGNREALALLDPPIGERVAALLRPRPMFWDVASDEYAGYRRDFRSLDEIEESKAAVEMAEVLGALLVDRLGLDVSRTLLDGERLLGHPPRFSAALLTVLAWHAARGELRGDPLPADVVSDFLRNVGSRRTAPPQAPPRALELFLRGLAERFALTPRELSVLQSFGRYCLERLGAECGALDPGVPVDRRYVSCLLMAQ